MIDKKIVRVEESISYQVKHEFRRRNRGGEKEYV